MPLKLRSSLLKPAGGIALLLALAGIIVPNREPLHLIGIHIASVLGKTADVHSFELQDLPVRPTYKESVYAWVAKYRDPIMQEARKRRINAVAIAGVIAYEAIENPIPSQLQSIVRFSGPGKIHYKQWRTSEGNPVARQVEVAGYLPKRTVLQREKLLRSPRAAIMYIAAIMDAYAGVSSRNGHPIRCRSDLLATFFNGWDIPSAEQFLAMDRGRSLRPSVVGLWVKQNSQDLRNALRIRTSACGLTR